MKDTVTNVAKIAIDSVAQNGTGIESTNWWIYIAIAELIIICVLIFFLLHKKKKQKTKDFKKIVDNAKNEEVDFGNIIQSAFHADELYSKLIRKVHPDRFPTDPQLNKIAEALSQEIGKNKTNLKRLKELEKEAKEKLNINFKKI